MLRNNISSVARWGVYLLFWNQIWRRQFVDRSTCKLRFFFFCCKNSNEQAIFIFSRLEFMPEDQNRDYYWLQKREAHKYIS